jgi:hypothetical protein
MFQLIYFCLQLCHLHLLIFKRYCELSLDTGQLFNSDIGLVNLGLFFSDLFFQRLVNPLDKLTLLTHCLEFLTRFLEPGTLLVGYSLGLGRRIEGGFE